MKYHSAVKTKITTIWFFLLLLSFSNSVLASPKAEKALTKMDKARYLFIQSASKIKIVANKKHPNTYKITLKNVNPYVTCFSDRPYRNTRMIPTEKFVELWHQQRENSFLRNPPNAGLIATQTNFFSKDKLMNFVVELTEPHYNAKAKTLTYIVKPVPGSTTLTLAPMTLHNVLLFIDDDVCLSCWEL
jgi:hypothetical protein